MTKRKWRIPNTVAEIVAPGDVADLVRRFERDVLPDAVGVVVVYLDRSGGVGIDVAGLSEVQALGAIEFGKSLILGGDDAED